LLGVLVGEEKDGTHRNVRTQEEWEKKIKSKLEKDTKSHREIQF